MGRHMHPCNSCGVVVVDPSECDPEGREPPEGFEDAAGYGNGFIAWCPVERAFHEFGGEL